MVNFLPDFCLFRPLEVIVFYCFFQYAEDYFQAVLAKCSTLTRDFKIWLGPAAMDPDNPKTHICMGAFDWQRVGLSETASSWEINLKKSKPNKLQKWDVYCYFTDNHSFGFEMFLYFCFSCDGFKAKAFSIYGNTVETENYGWQKFFRVTEPYGSVWSPGCWTAVCRSCRSELSVCFRL